MEHRAGRPRASRRPPGASRALYPESVWNTRSRQNVTTRPRAPLTPPLRFTLVCPCAVRPVPDIRGNFPDTSPCAPLTKVQCLFAALFFFEVKFIRGEKHQSEVHIS